MSALATHYQKKATAGSYFSTKTLASKMRAATRKALPPEDFAFEPVLCKIQERLREKGLGVEDVFPSHVNLKRVHFMQAHKTLFAEVPNYIRSHKNEKSRSGLVRSRSDMEKPRYTLLAFSS